MNTTQSATGAAIMGIGFPNAQSYALTSLSSSWSAGSFSNMTVQLFNPQVRGASNSAAGM